MLTRLKIQNFKSIGGEIEVELNKLTVLTGLNNAGKSNVLQPLLLVAQAAKDERNRDLLQPSDRTRTLFRYEKNEHLIHNRDLGLELGIAISARLDAWSMDRQGISKDYRAALSKFLRNTGGLLNPEIEWEFKARLGDMYNIFLFLSQRLFVNKKEVLGATWLRTLRIGAGSTDTVEMFAFGKKLDDGWQGNPQLAQFSTNALLFLPKQNMSPEETSRTTCFLDLYGELIETFRSRIFYVGPERGEIDFFVGTGGKSTEVGSKGEQLIQMLSKFSRAEKRDAQERFKGWCAEFGFESVSSGFGDNNTLVPEYSEKQSPSVVLPLYSTSFGRRQLLPVLLQLALCRKGDTLIVEEPEISHHPEYQVKLAEIFAEAVKNGIQIIMTTHSENLILGLEFPLRNKVISDSDITVNHVFRRKDRSSDCKKLNVIDKGHVVEWPEHFKKTEQALANIYFTVPPEIKGKKKKDGRGRSR